MTPPKPVSVKNKIYQSVRNEITSGVLLPGVRVKETWLTEKFGCSRGPAREALNQLEKEGFIELNPNQGATVTKISPDEVEDYYDLLQILEGKAAEWATPHLKTEDIDRLVAINGAIRQIPRDSVKCFEEWVPLNLSFHRLFRERCGNAKLDWLVNEVRMRITRFRYTSLTVSSFDDYLEDHERLIAAVRRRDANGARLAMEEHIGRARTVIMSFLSRLSAF